ncbi:unnamed protein product [Ceratitis capitata]|uniref:(Mediterranean fruit fly) hypothetical protein n=1 Tax=Ceratitis capitata TaxID=7213 RepID=A0A811VK38_CERCA|nr:unnamed protein product [Ceratitis capitata]
MCLQQFIQVADINVAQQQQQYLRRTIHKFGLHEKAHGIKSTEAPGKAISPGYRDMFIRRSTSEKIDLELAKSRQALSAAPLLDRFDSCEPRKESRAPDCNT